MRDAEQGKPLPDLLRERGIAAPTFYRWKSKYSGMEPSRLHWLRELERENGKVKTIAAYTNLETFFEFYNEQRPHSAFGMTEPKTPIEIYRQPIALAINQ